MEAAERAEPGEGIGTSEARMETGKRGVCGGQPTSFVLSGLESTILMFLQIGCDVGVGVDGVDGVDGVEEGTGYRAGVCDIDGVVDGG